MLRWSESNLKSCEAPIIWNFSSCNFGLKALTNLANKSEFQSKKTYRVKILQKMLRWSETNPKSCEATIIWNFSSCNFGSKALTNLAKELEFQSKETYRVKILQKHAAVK